MVGEIINVECEEENKRNMNSNGDAMIALPSRDS